MVISFSVAIDPSGDPAAAARWCAAFQYHFEESLAGYSPLRGEGPDHADGAGDDGRQADEMVRRWVNHNPANAEKLHAAVRGLRGLGYTLAPSEPRSSSDSRTYLRVLRSGDGANAGNMNSGSFGFIKARLLVADAPGVQHDGRYPTIKWAHPGSVETVLDAATRYLRA